jgi:ubiquinone/menaquinone biosynthesis C-methylase UbiE
MSPYRHFARQFGRPSGSLGHMAGWIMASRRSNRARNAWTLDLLEIAPTHQVLELGFGPGYALGLAAARLTAGRVVGLDHSEVMLAQARRRNAAAVATGRVQLILGGTDRLASLAGRFDRIYSANFIQFVPDPDALLRDLHRLLDRNGRIATTYQPRHPGARDADALRFAETLLERKKAAGFADCRIETNPHHGLLTVCVLGRRP